MIQKKEISALLSLIEDPDEGIYEQIKDKLLSLGVAVIPAIENAWEVNDFGKDYQSRLETIIHEIQFKDILNSLKHWKDEGALNLLDGVILVNKYQYPSLNRKKIEEQINLIAQDAEIEISNHMTGLEKIEILNDLIYNIHGFSGNKENYYLPSNSFLTNTLDSKKGNALLLAIVYLEIANRLKIPLVGVNLPNHFVLGYLDINKINDQTHDEKNTHILFYINAFSGGDILSINEINDFLDKINLNHNPEYYQACKNEDIIKRLITNLSYSYKKIDAINKAEELDQLLSLFE